MKLRLKCFGLILFNLFCFPAMAFHSMMTHGHFFESGQYRVTAEAQFLTTQDSGMNVNLHGETFISNDVNIKGSLGIGNNKYNLGAALKWVPVPDLEDQPALGVLGGFVFGQVDGENDFTFKLNPFVSKLLEAELGDVTPYLSLSLNLRNYERETTTPLQLILGSSIKPKPWEHMNLFIEGGLDLNDSFSYFSVGFSVDATQESGFQFF